MKKVIYILNLLFLTLSVFGGSVFAAAPTEYIGENGETRTLSTAPTPLTNAPEGGNWYYLDSSNSYSNLAVTIGKSTLGSPVNIVVNGPVNATSSYILVPKDTYVNFYGATTSSSLTIENTVGTFTIGNGTGGAENGNFGTINFNSGTYTVRNSSGSVPIGSKVGSGGTITVNQAATVRPYADNGGILVGTQADGQNCTINVAGGLLDCTSGNGQFVFKINVGTSGSVNISNQGKIWTLSSPEDLNNHLNIASTGGIYGYTKNYSNTANTWNAVVGGEVTVPTFNENGEPDQSFLQPLAGTYWSSITVTSNGNLTLGVLNPDNPDAGFSPATFSIGGGPGSYVNNYGTITVNSVNQTYASGFAYPNLWNNLPGSVLTVSENADLTAYSLINGSNLPSQESSTINIDGDLIIEGGFPPSNVTNYSQLNISQTGNVQGSVTNGSNTPDSPGASLTLNGEITENLTNNSSGSVTVGPIGTVDGQLNNEPGGTVTSQNPWVAS